MDCSAFSVSAHDDEGERKLKKFMKAGIIMAAGQEVGAHGSAQDRDGGPRLMRRKVALDGDGGPEY